MDYEKDFDSIETWAVLDSLERCHIDWQYIEVMRCLYEAATMIVQIQDQQTKLIQLQRGVRQGDVIPPKLFTNELDDVGIQNADDIVRMAPLLQELIGVLLDLNDAARRMGLGLNLGKTKVMFNNQIMPRSIHVEGVALEVVQDNAYLGKIIRLGRGNFDKESVRRVQRCPFGKLSHFLLGHPSVL